MVYKLCSICMHQNYFIHTSKLFIDWARNAIIPKTFFLIKHFCQGGEVWSASSLYHAKYVQLRVSSHLLDLNRVTLFVSSRCHSLTEVSNKHIANNLQKSFAFIAIIKLAVLSLSACKFKKMALYNFKCNISILWSFSIVRITYTLTFHPLTLATWG